MRLRVSQVAMVPLFLWAIALIAQQVNIGLGQPNSVMMDQLIESEQIIDRL